MYTMESGKPIINLAMHDWTCTRVDAVGVAFAETGISMYYVDNPIGYINGVHGAIIRPTINDRASVWGKRDENIFGKHENVARSAMTAL